MRTGRAGWRQRRNAGSDPARAGSWQSCWVLLPTEPLLPGGSPVGTRRAPGGGTSRKPTRCASRSLPVRGLCAAAQTAPAYGGHEQGPTCHMMSHDVLSRSRPGPPQRPHSSALCASRASRPLFPLHSGDCATAGQVGGACSSPMPPALPFQTDHWDARSGNTITARKSGILWCAVHRRQQGDSKRRHSAAALPRSDAAAPCGRNPAAGRDRKCRHARI